MYTVYWQLDRKPFEPDTTGGFFYPSESHRGAILKLRYAIESGRGAAVIAGPSGVGKTLLVDTLIEQLPQSEECRFEEFQTECFESQPSRTNPVIKIVYPQMSSRELLAYLAARLSPEDESAPSILQAPSVDQSWRQIETALAAADQRGERPLVVIDEAHLLEDTGALETIRLLLNLQSKGRPLVTLLLIGQSPLLSTLGRTPRLEERLDITALLEPLAADEVRPYVEHRMRAAGATREIFTPEAIDALQYLAQGVPRKINRLGDLALLVGYAGMKETINAPLVESVATELAFARAA